VTCWIHRLRAPALNMLLVSAADVAVAAAAAAAPAQTTSATA